MAPESRSHDAVEGVMGQLLGHEQRLTTSGRVGRVRPGTAWARPVRALLTRLNDWAASDREAVLRTSPVWRFQRADDGIYVEIRLR